MFEKMSFNTLVRLSGGDTIFSRMRKVERGNWRGLHNYVLRYRLYQARVRQLGRAIVRALGGRGTG